MVFPSKDEYLRLAERYGLVPVWEELPLDLETPVSLFQKVVKGEYAFLLESVTGGEQLARYSLIGFDPLFTFKAKGEEIEVDGDYQWRGVGEPLSRLMELLESLQAAPVIGQPRFFGGAVGYAGYDLVRCYHQLPDVALDDLQLPDCFFMVPKTVLIYDHVRCSLKAAAFVPSSQDPAGAYEESQALIRGVIERIKGSQNSREVPGVTPSERSGGVSSNLSREGFISRVQSARELIRAGELAQVVLSLRFQCIAEHDPFQIYRRLRHLNPSPYMFYLKCADLVLVGSSPEMLVRCEQGVVETHPIAGTRPRGKGAEIDAALARELLRDPKERAEHLMLLELGKDDLSQVCAPGSVEVTRFMESELYSHVIHLASTVQGMLSTGQGPCEALLACFPAGTVSGAPRERALEVIEQLEPTRRGPYAGAVGYFSFSGSLDSCIAIRTIVFKGKTAYVQSGAGIVAASDPQKEYLECLNKAAALLQVLE